MSGSELLPKMTPGLNPIPLAAADEVIE